jgi:hypothetical protein
VACRRRVTAAPIHAVRVARCATPGQANELSCPSGGWVRDVDAGGYIGGQGVLLVHLRTALREAGLNARDSLAP